MSLTTTGAWDKDQGIHFGKAMRILARLDRCTALGSGQLVEAATVRLIRTWCRNQSLGTTDTGSCENSSISTRREQKMPAEREHESIFLNEKVEETGA